MVEYIESGQLVMEVWGSQKEVAQPKPAAGKGADKKAAGGKSTKELMAAEKAKVCMCESDLRPVFIALHYVHCIYPFIFVCVRLILFASAHLRELSYYPITVQFPSGIV